MASCSGERCLLGLHEHAAFVTRPLAFAKSGTDVSVHEPSCQGGVDDAPQSLTASAQQPEPTAFCGGRAIGLRSVGHAREASTSSQPPPQQQLQQQSLTDVEQRPAGPAGSVQPELQRDQPAGLSASPCAELRSTGDYRGGVLCGVLQGAACRAGRNVFAVSGPVRASSSPASSAVTGPPHHLARNWNATAAGTAGQPHTQQQQQQQKKQQQQLAGQQESERSYDCAASQLAGPWVRPKALWSSAPGPTSNAPFQNSRSLDLAPSSISAPERRAGQVHGAATQQQQQQQQRSCELEQQQRQLQPQLETSQWFDGGSHAFLSAGAPSSPALPPWGPSSIANTETATSDGRVLEARGATGSGCGAQSDVPQVAAACWSAPSSQVSTLLQQHPCDVGGVVLSGSGPPACPNAPCGLLTGRPATRQLTRYHADTEASPFDGAVQQEQEQQLHLPPRLTPSAALARRGVALSSTASEAPPPGVSPAVAASGGRRVQSAAGMPYQLTVAPPRGAPEAVGSAASCPHTLFSEGACAGGSLGTGAGGAGDEGDASGNSGSGAAGPLAKNSFRNKYGTMAAAAGLKATADRRLQPPASPAPRGFSGMRPMTWGGSRAAFGADSVGSAGGAYAQAAMEGGLFLGTDGMLGGQPGAGAALGSVGWVLGGAGGGDGEGSIGDASPTGGSTAMQYDMRVRASVLAQLPPVRRQPQLQTQPWGGGVQQGLPLEPMAAAAAGMGHVLEPDEGSGCDSSGHGGGSGAPGIRVPSPGQRAPLMLPQYGGSMGSPAPYGTPRPSLGHGTPPEPLPYGFMACPAVAGLHTPLPCSFAACPTVAEDDEEASSLYRTASSLATATERGSGSGATAAFGGPSSAAGSNPQRPPALGPTTPPSKTAAARPAPVTPPSAFPHASPRRHHTPSGQHNHHHASISTSANARGSDLIALSTSGIRGVPCGDPSTTAQLGAEGSRALAAPCLTPGEPQQLQPGPPGRDSPRLEFQMSSLVSTLSWSSTLTGSSSGPDHVDPTVPAAAAGAGGGIGPEGGQAAPPPAPELTAEPAVASLALQVLADGHLVHELQVRDGGVAADQQRRWRQQQQPPPPQQQHFITPDPVAASVTPTADPAAASVTPKSSRSSPEASPAAQGEQHQPQQWSSNSTDPHQDQAGAELLPTFDTAQESLGADVEDEAEHQGHSMSGSHDGGAASGGSEASAVSDGEVNSDGGAAAPAVAACGIDTRGRGSCLSATPALAVRRTDRQGGQQQQQRPVDRRGQPIAPLPPLAVATPGARLRHGGTTLERRTTPVSGELVGAARMASSSTQSGSSAGKQRMQRQGTGLGLLVPDPVGAAAGVLRRSEFTFGEPRAKWRRASVVVMKNLLHQTVLPSGPRASTSSAGTLSRRSTAVTAVNATPSQVSPRRLPQGTAAAAVSGAVSTVSTSSASPPPYVLGADQAALQLSVDQDAAATPADLAPSLSSGQVQLRRLTAEQQQQQLGQGQGQQHAPSPTSAFEPTTPFGAVAATHYYQSVVQQDFHCSSGRPSCVLEPLPQSPPGPVLPLTLSAGHGSASTSAGPSPRFSDGGGCLPARLDSSDLDDVSPAHPFRLTLLPCKPGSEVDNLLSLAANIFQVPVVMTAALLPGTFFIKLNEPMIAAAIAAGHSPATTAAAAVSAQPSASSLSSPVVSSQACPFNVSYLHTAAAAGATAGTVGRPTLPSARAAGQAMAAAVAGARTAAQVAGEVEWQLELGGWAVSASLDVAAGVPYGAGRSAGVLGGVGGGEGAMTGGQGGSGQVGIPAEGGDADPHVVIVEDAATDVRTCDEAFARMAPPVRFVLAVPLETADAEEAAGSAGSSRRSSMEGGAAEGFGARGAAALPRLLGALCLADFKPRPASSISRPLLDNVRRLLLSHLGRDVQMYDERQRAKAVLAELVGSLQRLLDRYDTAVMLVSLPAMRHTPRCSADGGAGAGAAGAAAGAAGPAAAREGEAASRELRWPVLYVNHAWTALTGLKRDDVVGQDLRDIFTTAASPNLQPSTAALRPPGASGHVPQAGCGAGTLVSTAPPGAPLLGVASRRGSAATTATAATNSTARSECHVPILWERHQQAVAARDDIVLHHVVLPVGGAAGDTAAAGAGPGGGAAGGSLATLHFRFVAREAHEESGLLPAGWQSLLGTIREDGCRAFVLVRPAPAQSPSQPRSALGAPEEITEASPSYAAALSQHCTSKVPGLELSHLLGKGGFGSVYCGTWHGTAVAVKMIDVSGNRLAVECASLEAVMGQALDHPHIVKTLMFLARGRDGPMVRIGGGGDGGEGGGGGGTSGGLGNVGLTGGSMAGSSSALKELLRAGGAAGGAGGGTRGHRPARNVVSVPTASLPPSSIGAASGYSRLSLPAKAPTTTSSSGAEQQQRPPPPTDEGHFGGFQAFMVDRGGSTFDACGGRAFGGPPAGEGSTGLGWMEGSMTAGSAAQLRGGFMGDPTTGEGGRGQSPEGRAAESTGARTFALWFESGHRGTGTGTGSVRPPLGQPRSLVPLAGGACERRSDNGGGHGGLVRTSSNQSCDRSPPRGISNAGFASSRSGSNALGSTAQTFLAGRLGGTPLAAVPESVSSSAGNTYTVPSKARQHGGSADRSTSVGTSHNSHPTISPFLAHAFLDPVPGTTPSIAEGPYGDTSTAMAAGLQQSRNGRGAIGGRDAAAAGSVAPAAAFTAVSPALGRVKGGSGSSSFWFMGDGSGNVGGGLGGGDGGGSTGLMTMDSSQVAAAARLTSASALWRQRRGSTAASAAAVVASGDMLLGSGSTARRHVVGTGEGPPVPGPADASAPPADAGGFSMRGRRGSIGGATGERPPLPPRHVATMVADQVPVPPSKGSSASWLAAADDTHTAACANPQPQQQPSPYPPPLSASFQTLFTLHRARPSPLPPLPPSVSSDSASGGAAAEGSALGASATEPVAGLGIHSSTAGLPSSTQTTGPGPDRCADPVAGQQGTMGDVWRRSAADDPEVAAAKKAHRRALLLLTTDASGSITPLTSTSPALSTASPQPPPSPPAPWSQPQLQRAASAAQDASRRACVARTPSGLTAPVSAFAAASQRRLSSGPFMRPGLAPPGGAVAGKETSRGICLALSAAPSAETALMRPSGRAVAKAAKTSPVGFPSTAAEASAVRHGAKAGGAPHAQHPHGRDRGCHDPAVGGGSVPWEHARREEGQEEEELAAMDGGSFSDIDSVSELMGTDVLDSPRTAAREAHVARKAAEATAAAVAMAAAAGDPSVGCALGAFGSLGHPGGAGAGTRAGFGAGGGHWAATMDEDPGSSGGPLAGAVSEVWIVMEYCDLGTLQLALEEGLFVESPTASLTSSAGPAAAHAPAVLPSGASGGAQLHSLAGSSSMLTPPPGGRRGSWCGGSAAAAGAAHAHVSAARRVDMRALVATALEVASALRYLHDLGIVHGDLTARNVMLVSLERAGSRHAHAHAHTDTQPGQGSCHAPATSARTPSPSHSHSHSHSHTTATVARQSCSEDGRAACRGGAPGAINTARKCLLATGRSSVGNSTAVLAGALPGASGGGATSAAAAADAVDGPPSIHHAFGPRHVCHVPPSAAASPMPGLAPVHVSTTSAGIATPAARDGNGGSSGSPLAAAPGTGQAADPTPSRPTKAWAAGPGAGATGAGGVPPADPVCGGCGRCFVAKVADFGLSRTLDTQSKILTKTTGTITSMPPETLLSGTVSKAADVYAYGVLLWQMYTGQRPWGGMNHGQVVYNVGMKGQQLPFPPDTPHGLLALSRACTRSAARDRPTFAQLQHHLAQLATELGLPVEAGP